MAHHTEDIETAVRMIERFGNQAAAQTRQRISELEDSGECTAAEQWRRILQLVEFELDKNGKHTDSESH